MINRIFKTILVLSIVLGITLPSNAAVSVSDGSAFVTKAEFAADLNNLSNRMAQLENSLDAKIDSLVSSYLTRNGIWNGAKQYNGYFYQFVNYGQFTDAQWVNFFKGYGNAFDSAWVRIGDGTTLTKSGLLICEIRDFGPTSDYDEWWHAGGHIGDPGGFEIGKTGIECLLRTGTSIDSGHDVARMEVYSIVNPTAAMSSTSYIGFKPSSVLLISSFMVEKGSYIYARLKTFGGQRSHSSGDSLGGRNATARSTNGIQVGNLTIY